MEEPADLASSLKLVLCNCESGCEARTHLDDWPLCHSLIRLLAQVRPLSHDQLERDTGHPMDDLAQRLDRMDLDFDQASRVIGAGLTLRATPHRFEIAGRQLYTWCALDALMYPGLLAETVRVESPCRATGQPVRVVVTPGGVSSVDSADTVVSLVVPQPGQPPRQAF